MDSPGALSGPQNLPIPAHSQHPVDRKWRDPEHGLCMLHGLGSNPSSTTHNPWILEQVLQPCCASLFLSIKWVAVTMNYVNIGKGFKDFDASAL